MSPKEAFRRRRAAKIVEAPAWTLSFAAYKEQQSRRRFEAWARRGERPKDRVASFQRYLKVHGIEPSERYRRWIAEGRIPRGQVPDFENWYQSKRVDPRRLKVEYDAMESRMESPEWRAPDGHEYPGDRRKWMEAVKQAKVRGEAVSPRIWDEYERLKSLARVLQP